MTRSKAIKIALFFLGNEMESLLALSPLDGRYKSQLIDLQRYFSEYALIFFRLKTELAWWKALSFSPEIKELPPFSQEALQVLEDLEQNFKVEDAQAIKNIEKTTNHDVKALEYWIREKIQSHAELQNGAEFIHFALTSEDINNVAHALMLKNFQSQILLPQLESLLKIFKKMALDYAALPMMSRTHGQPATPTTMGKEIANIGTRLQKSIYRLQNTPLEAKINGAVGNFNAHLIAYPQVDWQALAGEILNKLGLTQNLYTIQIEPHDSFAQLFDEFSHLATLLIDAARDIWGYIALGYFRQKLKKGEVGSSTMPHKVNPIDFENAEGNLGLARAFFTHFSHKLPISRFQRDLSDSTVLRNMGVAAGYLVLALKSLEKGLNKLAINEGAMEEDLKNNPALLAEAVQTVMRRFGVPNAYDQLKTLTRGEKISLAALREFVEGLAIPQESKDLLLDLTPENYLGKAETPARHFAES